MLLGIFISCRLVMKVKFLFILLLLCSLGLQAQNKVLPVLLSPVFGNQKLNVGTDWYHIARADSIQIHVLKFYISKLRLLDKGKVVWQEENSFHLVDVENSTSLKWNLLIPPTITFSQISFELGIDSITNVSGALGGDLDPTKGMYWTWQNGYINFKLEGLASSSSANKNEFQFHLGGYQYPFLACKTIILDQINEDGFVIEIDLKKVLVQADLNKENHIMSPSIEAVKWSHWVQKSFSIIPK